MPAGQAPTFHQPLAFWRATPPTHHITCVLVSRDGARVATGAREGFLVLWEFVDEGDGSLHSPWPSHPAMVANVEGRYRQPTADHCAVAHCRPYCLLVGCESGIVAITECVAEEGPAVCSLFADGSLAVWLFADGRCTARSDNIDIPQPCAVVPLPGLVHVLVAGHPTHLTVVDVLAGLTVLARIPTDGCVTALPASLTTAVPPGELRRNYVIAAITERQLQYWDVAGFPETGSNPHPHRLVGSAPIDVQDGEPVGCDQTSQCERVLVVWTTCALLYTYRSTTPSSCVEPGGETRFTGGRFLTASRIVLYRSDGNVVVYELAPRQASGFPLTPLTPVGLSSPTTPTSPKTYPGPVARPVRSRTLGNPVGQQERKSKGLGASMMSFLPFTSRKPKAPVGPVGRGTPIPGAPVPIVSNTHLQATQGRRSRSSETMLLASSLPSGEDFLSRSLSPTPLPKAATADRCVTPPAVSDSTIDSTNGQLSPRPFSDEEEGLEELLPVLQTTIEVGGRRAATPVPGRLSTSCLDAQRPLLVCATEGTLHVWTAEGTDAPLNHVEAVVSLPACWDSHTLPADVSVCHVSLELGGMVEGYRDGRVRCHSTLHGEHSWQAHDTSITALRVVDDYLLTAARDGVVKVWGVETCALAQQFHHHSMAVRRFFDIPPDLHDRLNATVCSIGDDRSIIFYSLRTMQVVMVMGGHSADIEALYWMPDMDFCLIGCTDTALYVWHMSPGFMERRLTGEEASTFLEKLSSMSPRCFNQLGITPLGLPIAEERPTAIAHPGVAFTSDQVPLLSVDVRALVATIHREAEASRAIRAQSTPPADGPLPALVKPFPLSPKLHTTLSYLFQYDEHPSIDKIRQQFALLPRPDPAPSLALKGFGNTMSLLAPAIQGQQVYTVSPVLTATRSVTMLAVLYALIAFSQDTLKMVCKECINFYILHLPKYLPGYQFPSFLWCASWLPDPSPDVRFAARCAMNAVLKGASPDDVHNLTARLIASVKDAALVGQNPSHTIALCVVCIQVTDKVPKGAVHAAAHGLLSILKRGGAMHSYAISLLGDKFWLWRPAIASNEREVLQHLFLLTLPADGSASPSARRPDTDVVKAASHALTGVGEGNPKVFLEFMEIVLKERPIPEQCHGITCINVLVRRHPSAMYPHLFTMVGLILKVLDPHVPAVRDHCLSAAQTALRTAVSSYSMVAFHQPKQKLAVGDQSGQVIVYNIKTATKCTPPWAAHDKGISCVQFSPEGEYLTTYCSQLAIVKVWHYETGVLGISSNIPKRVRSWPVQHNKVQDVQHIIQNARLDWEGNQIKLSGCTTNKPSVWFPF